MSETVSNAEIEDVLSSIRKLVSENAGNETRRGAADEAGDDKLVLTPAFRVLDQAAPPEPETVPDRAASPAGDHGLEDRIAELEEAVSETADEWEPDGSEDMLDAPTSFVFAHAGGVIRHTKSPGTGAGSSADRPARLHLASGPGIEVAAPPPAPETDAVQSKDEPVDPSTGAVTAKVEAVPAETETTQPAAPQEPSAGTAEPEPAPAGTAPVVRSETALDEQALTELVSRLVREELQGQIGERITRNVRRLVRREIQRAFALRDLE